MTKTALIAGATGMTGKQLLKKLIACNIYNKVIVLVRNHISIEHLKAEVVVVDYDKLEDFASKLIADDVFCCMGTTIKKAKSKDAFRKVDYYYPVKLASLTQKNGATQFMVISSIGANSHSKIFYSKVKGLMENELQKTSFNTIRIFRPSLLLGEREEFRFGEKMGIGLYKMFSWLFTGSLKRYKAIEANVVAQGMLNAAQLKDKGIFVYESDEINRMSK